MQLCGRLSILWHCLSLGLEWKWAFSRPVASDEFPNLLAYWLQHFYSICLQSFPDWGLFQWGGSSHQMVKVWKLQLQHQSFQWLIWSSWSPRDPQESSPAPPFKIINYAVLSLPYGPTVTSIYDSWINHSLAYMDICLQRDVLLLICCVF